MKTPNGTEIKALFILSIIVPVGLLATFRLTGILEEPPRLERITLDRATLTLPRPPETMTVTNTSVERKWVEMESLITVQVRFIEYREGPNTPAPYSGHDGLMFALSVNASLTKELLSTINISFHPQDGNGILYVSEERWSLHLNDVTLIGLYYPGTNRTEAYIRVNGSGPSCSISDELYWVFLDENGPHDLLITVEVMQTSKTLARTVSIPIELNITSLGM